IGNGPPLKVVWEMQFPALSRPCSVYRSSMLLMPTGLIRIPIFARSDCRRSATTSDRKSTRLNSSHSQISYAVFCLKKKKYENRIVRAHVRTSVTVKYRIQDYARKITNPSEAGVSGARRTRFRSEYQMQADSLQCLM